jgi:hypothetical protein
MLRWAVFASSASMTSAGRVAQYVFRAIGRASQEFRRHHDGIDPDANIFKTSVQDAIFQKSLQSFPEGD